MMAETPTLYVCHGDDGGPRRHPCRRVQEALRAATRATAMSELQSVLGGDARDPDGRPLPPAGRIAIAEGVVVRRKAAGTLSVRAEGRASHSGSAPDRGRNALLALAAAVAMVTTTAVRFLRTNFPKR